MSWDAPCPFTFGDPIDIFALNTSFASLPPNTYEPPTILTFLASLSLKGKGLMVDELTSISTIEVFNGLVIIQPKKKRKVEQEINQVY